jgi:hypothetical protein
VATVTADTPLTLAWDVLNRTRMARSEPRLAAGPAPAKTPGTADAPPAGLPAGTGAGR